MKLVIANWKTNPRTIEEVKKYFTTFKRKKRNERGVTTVFCPPTLFAHEVAKAVKANRKAFLGLQDIYWEEEGSHTGETGLLMAKEAGARFVICGHSERRANGENNDIIAKKVTAALEYGFHVVLCVGEAKRDSSGAYLREIRDQLYKSLDGVKKSQLAKLVIAYEPVWAIGKGKRPPQTHEIAQTSLYIKKLLIQHAGKKAGQAIPILYGGSTNAENVKEIIYEGDVDGVLVGRSSLNPHEFSDMINETAK
jgi:triosephosphate isomerase